ncbi:MAG TPA: hypothetical protein VFI56_03160 [Vicinamibacterales bacterium]|nr:hypothetical protein [Vicinamibacterales bacterium]
MGHGTLLSVTRFAKDVPGVLLDFRQEWRGARALEFRHLGGSRDFPAHFR